MRGEDEKQNARGMFIIEPNEWKDEMEYLILFQKERKRKKIHGKMVENHTLRQKKPRNPFLSFERKTRKKVGRSNMRKLCRIRRTAIGSEIILNFFQID